MSSCIDRNSTTPNSPGDGTQLPPPVIPHRYPFRHDRAEDLARRLYPHPERRSASDWRIPCPAHRGEDCNLSIFDTDHGPGVRCYSHHCPSAAIWQAIHARLGGALHSAAPAAGPGTPHRRPYHDHCWIYPHRDGSERLVYRRNSPKRIWQAGGPLAGTQPLIHTPAVPVTEGTLGTIAVLCEGEKAAEAVAACGPSVSSGAARRCSRLIQPPCRAGGS